MLKEKTVTSGFISCQVDEPDLWRLTGLPSCLEILEGSFLHLVHPLKKKTFVKASVTSDTNQAWHLLQGSVMSSGMTLTMEAGTKPRQPLANALQAFLEKGSHNRKVGAGWML